MRAWSPAALALDLVGVGAASSLAGWLLWTREAPLWGGVVLVAAALGIVLLRQRRALRRLVGNAAPPPGVVAALEAEVRYYKRLAAPEQERFRAQVAWFLQEQRIQGVGVEVDDTLRALVAASAVILSFGIPGYAWETTRDILLYPEAFDADYSVGRGKGRLGQVGVQGPVIFSTPALRSGFAQGADGHNVGLHEFAHVLDFDDGEIDGLPANLSWPLVRPWLDAMHAQLQRKDRRHSRVLRDYGYTNEAEFFACSVEMFFEQPRRMRDKAPELYEILSGFFKQDPASLPD